jgi:hypothetical protein
MMKGRGGERKERWVWCREERRKMKGRRVGRYSRKERGRDDG